VLHCIQISIII